MLTKKGIRNIGIVILSFIMITLINIKPTQAAVSASNTSVTLNSGASVTVRISASNATGTVAVSGGGSVASASASSNWIENNSINVTISARTAGTTTVTVSGVVSDSTGRESSYSIPISVTVNATSTGTNPGASGGNQGSTSGNNQGGTSGSNQSSTAGSAVNSRAATTDEVTKSSNANLSNLGIRPNDFSGFKAGTTSYNVTVPTDVESVEIYATKQDAKSTITGTGTKTLEEGLNNFSVVVTAEDGTTKTYTLAITRTPADGTETGDEVEEPVEGLTTLSFEDADLTPTFDPKIFEYTANYIGTKTSLNIGTTASDENYVVEVLGNEDLKEGENTITILVSDTEGENIATYQVTVNKSLVDQEAIAREEALRQEQENRKRIMIISGVVAAVILVIIIILVIRHRRNSDYYYEDDYDYDYDDNKLDNKKDNLFEDTKEHEIPKAADLEKEKKAYFETINEEDIEKLPKEELKKEYLNSFGDNPTSLEDDFDYNVPRKRKSKGKRFK